MFSFLRKTDKNKPVEAISSQIRSAVNIIDKERTDSIDDLKINYDSSVAIEVNVEVGGGKGWPVDVTTVLYHKLQGLICIGTSGGAIYVYGDGFQFMRPWLINDPNPVQDIVALYNNRILVAFEDNSIVVMELPTLDVVDLLPSTWLSNESPGVLISSIHVDLPMEKNFVYVGTNDASVFVLDASSSTIRVCEYKVTSSDLGVSNSTTVVDIQSCPKDEKYLAIGLNESAQKKRTKASSPACVVIFDLGKHKPYKSFPTAFVSSLAWIHTGDLLYVGTVDGNILCVNFEKNLCTNVWNSSQELADETDNNNNDDDSSVEENETPRVASIKRLSWMASQVSDDEEIGVLFVLLDTNSDSDNEDLTNVIIGLTPSGPVDGPQELNVVYSLPPIQSEKIKTFRVVPTSDLFTENDVDTDQPVVVSSVTPAILILSFSQISKFNQLKIVRCPTSGINHWSLEIGMTLDPRQAVEVLPSQSKITCISAIKSEKCPQSITTALINNNNDTNRRISNSYSMTVDNDSSTSVGFNYDENKTIQMDNNKTTTPPRKSTITTTGNRSTSRKLSVREFFFDNSLLESESKWEMTLAHGIQKENINKNTQRQQDLLIKGHADGTVIIWGVSLPDNGKELGRGNIWLPLQVLKCGTCAVVTINHDEASGLLLAADESGILVIWELFDENINMSATDILSNIYDEAVTMVAKQVGENLPPNPDDHLTIKDFAKFCYYSNKYRPSSFKFLLKSRFHDKVTCSLFMSCVMSLLVGTQDGSIYFCADFRKGTFSKLDIDLSKIDNSLSIGAVISLTLSSFEVKNKLIPVVYCVFSSGHLLVIELKNFSIVFATLGSLNQSFEDLTLRSKLGSTDENERSKDNHNMSIESNIFNSSHSLIKTPDVIDISLYRLSLEGNLLEQSQTSSDSITNNDNISSPSVPAPPPKSKMTSIFSSLTKNKNTTTTLPIAPPHDEPIIATNQSHESVPTLPQELVPRYLVFVNGRSLVSYDLAKNLVNLKPNNREFLSVAPLKSILTCNLISKKRIVATKLLEYIPNDTDEEADNLSCFACVNSLGVFFLVSIKNNTVISHTNLLESVLEDEVTNIDFGIVLDNSNCYMIQSSSMIYSATPICSTHSLASTFPDRGTVVCNPPNQEMMLLNGREGAIEQMKLMVKKRKSSIISMNFATDLGKLFSKSKNANQKDELFGEEEVNIAATKGSKMPNTNAALATCEELGKALEERGEKINRITKKMDLFKETANQFKQQAHEQREKLRKQNNNWGLF